MKRRIVVAVIVVIAAALLAYAMRERIERSVIQPLIYLWWVIGIYYDSIPKFMLWLLVVTLIVMIEIGSFATELPVIGRKKESHGSVQGSVEMLAGWFRRAPGGLYFKWLIAQRLGKLSREWIAFDARQVARFGRQALSGPGWDPPEEVAAYLESGLNGSFADYPRPRWPFQRPAPTPLDLDPQMAIDYLESKLDKA